MFVPQLLLTTFWGRFEAFPVHCSATTLQIKLNLLNSHNCNTELIVSLEEKKKRLCTQKEVDAGTLASETLKPSVVTATTAIGFKSKHFSYGLFHAVVTLAVITDNSANKRSSAFLAVSIFSTTAMWILSIINSQLAARVHCIAENQTYVENHLRLGVLVLQRQ